MSLDPSGRIDDDTFRVVQAVLTESYPPTNPAVLLKAMRAWYVVHGADAIMSAFMDWMCQVFQYNQNLDSIKYYAEGKAAFLDKTGVLPKAAA